MENIIKILPHHAISYFKVFYLGYEPGEEDHSYDEIMTNNDVSLIRTVTSNPNQLIQIVSNYDSFCEMCPRNKNGKNYYDIEFTCDNYDLPNNLDDEFTKFLGLENVLNGKPITAREFKEIMKTANEKLLNEISPSQHSQKKSLPHWCFRVREPGALLGTP